MIRYLSDGLLDPSFGTGGIDQVHLPNTGLNAVALQSDGKVVIAIETALQSGGFATSGVARLTSNGSLDKTFGNGGFANVQSPLQLGMGHSLVVQSDGRIVIDAFRPGNAPIEDIGLARFLANGTLDSTFGHNGVTLIPNLFASVSGLAVAQDGTLDALINSGFPGYAVHFSASGTFIEAPPSGNLAVITPAFNRMTFQPDAKIIGASLISRSSGGFVERFTRYNSTDPTFQTPFLSSYAFTLIAEPSGGILVAGESTGGTQRFAVQRFNPNGSADAGFGSGGIVETTFATRSAIVAQLLVQPDGKIVAVGSAFDSSTGTSNVALARYFGP